MSRISKILSAAKNGDLVFIAKSQHEATTWESVAFCNDGSVSYTENGIAFTKGMIPYLKKAEELHKPIGLFRLEHESSSFIERVVTRLLASPGIWKTCVNLVLLAIGKSPKFSKVLAQLGIDLSLIILQELHLNGSSIKHLHDSGKLVRLL